MKLLRNYHLLNLQFFKSVENSSVKGNDTSKDLYCAYCRAKGHVRADCEKLKQKDRAQMQLVPALPAPVVAAVTQSSNEPMNSWNQVILLISHRRLLQQWTTPWRDKEL